MTDPVGWPPKAMEMPDLPEQYERLLPDVFLATALMGTGPQTRPAFPLHMNLMRLVDKAGAEYRRARESIEAWIEVRSQMQVAPLVRAFSHLETCVDSLHRAAAHAERLRRERLAPEIETARLPFSRDVARLRAVRDAIQHAEADIVRHAKQNRSDEFALMLVAGERGLTIANHVLMYDELVRWIKQLHEVARMLAEHRDPPDEQNAGVAAEPAP